MATKLSYKTTYDVDHVIQPIFTGGSAVLRQDGRVLATSLGEDAILTDLTTGAQLVKIEGDGEIISGLALTPDGSHLIICSRSLSMRIYSLNSSDDNSTIEATILRTVKPHPAPVSVLTIDQTGTLLATGGKDGAIKVWDIRNGYVTHNFQGPSVLVSSLRFFELAQSSQTDKPSKKQKSSANTGEELGTYRFRLASGFQDGKVRIWDLHNRNCVAKLDSHVSDVQGLDYSPSQHTFVTASRDKTIIWWDTRSWKLRKLHPAFELLEAVGFVEDGRLTFSAGSNGCLRVWHTDTGRELTEEQPTKSESQGIVAALYHPGQPFILCVQVDHTLSFYRIPELSPHPPLPQLSPIQPFRWISGTHDEIIDLAYLLPDKSVLALATNSEEIRIVSVENRETSGVDLAGAESYMGQDIGTLKGHSEIVVTLDVDWSGHWVATGAKDNTAKLWRVDMVKGEFTCYATFSGHVQSVTGVALPKTVPQESSSAYMDPLDHPPLFLMTGSEDLTIKKWDIPRKPQGESKAARAAFTKKAHEKDINALDVHHAGQLFASASMDKTVKIWSTQEGEVQGILRGHRRGVWSVKFAPKDTPIVQGEDGPVAGKGVVLTASGDKTIKLWSLSDYTCLRTYEGHSHSVLKVAWLKLPNEADGKRRVQFASAGGDGLVKVWDANSGETECTLDNHEDRVWALAVHPISNTIVSGSGDSTVTFWRDTTSETQAAEAEAALKLVEQEQELQNHIYSGSYREAITLALQLNHPGRLLSIFTSVTVTDKPDVDSLCGLKAVDKVLANLSDEQIFLLLLRLRDWNTNARTSPVAQRILHALVKSYPASRFVNLSVRGARGQKSVKEVLNALRVYSERHYKRMDELLDESYFVEYTLQEMGTLLPMLEKRKQANSVDGEGDIIMF